MRVLFDARFITCRKTGVGEYAMRLLESLHAAGSLDLTALCHHPLPSAPPDLQIISTSVPFDSHPVGDFWRNTRLRSLLHPSRFDLFHSPGFYVIQSRTRVPQVVTVHDLAVFDVPGIFSRKFTRYLRWMIGSAARHADRVLTGSQFIADRLSSRYPDLTTRLEVIPFGVDRRFSERSTDLDASVARKWSLPDSYIFVMSTLEPRKNLERMLDAYAIYRRRAHRVLPLIIAGGDGYHADRIRRHVNKSELVTSVRFLGYVPESDQPSLYRLADFSVFPSLYEGFGFPVLESMRSGVPVICSNCSSLPEVAGGHALLVDAGSAVDMATAMVRLSEDSGLRHHLMKTGLEWASHFTWNRTAALTRDAYSRTAGR